MTPDHLRERLRDDPPRWNDVRERRVLSSTLEAWRDGRRRPHALKTAAVLSAALITVGGVWYGARSGTRTSSGPAPATLAHAPGPSAAPELTRTPARPSRLVLPDGSVATLSDGGAIALDRGVGLDERLVVRQTAGRVRYEVRHEPARSFVVWAGGIGVRVIGTVFTVAFHGDRVGVSVEDGVVRVDDGSREVVLRAGDELTTRLVSRTERPSSPVTPTSSRPARAGAPAAAANERPTVAAELAGADAARKAGNLPEAARLLRVFIEQHPRDARVPSALFTLGTVELRGGHPADAAASFRLCKDERPSGTLAEDAAAEEATAWRAAGDADRARAAAASYLAAYPRGAHAGAMQELAR